MQTLETKVTAVTVYQRDARCTRTGRITLPAGEHRLLIPNLPNGIHSHLPRVELRSSVSVVLKSTQILREYHRQAPHEKLQSLDQRIQDLKDQAAVFKDELSTLAVLVRHIDALLADAGSVVPALIKGKTDPEAHAALTETLARQREQRQAEIRAVKARRRELRKDLDRLQRERDGLINAGSPDRLAFQVDLALAEAGEVDLDLTYRLEGVAWVPTYDMHLTDTELELIAYAEVRNITGENWDQVALTLSTARPNQFAPLPEPETWRIGPVEEPPLLRKRDVRAAFSEISYETALDVTRPIVQEAAIEDSGLSVTFVVPGRTDIPDGGEPKQVRLHTLRLPAKTDFLGSPRSNPQVVRRVRVQNSTQGVFLPGSAQLFDHDELIGSSHVRLILPGQEFELPFGVEDRILVKREMIGQDVDRRLIGDRRRVRLGYRTTLNNHTRQAAAVTVLDALPLSNHESVKVRLESAHPSPAQDDLNRLTWSLTLAPGAEQTVTYEFSVEYPRDMELHGLPI